MADWGLIATAAATGGLVIFNGIQAKQAKAKRKREAELSKKYGLPDNPTRCGEHKERMDRLEVKMTSVGTDVAVLNVKMTALEKCADEIKDEVAALRDKK